MLSRTTSGNVKKCSETSNTTLEKRCQTFEVVCIWLTGDFIQIRTKWLQSRAPPIQNFIFLKKFWGSFKQSLKRTLVFKRMLTLFYTKIQKLPGLKLLTRLVLIVSCFSCFLLDNSLQWFVIVFNTPSEQSQPILLRQIFQAPPDLMVIWHGPCL